MIIAEIGESSRVIVFLVFLAFAIIKIIIQHAQAGKKRHTPDRPPSADPDLSPRPETDLSPIEQLRTLLELADDKERPEINIVPAAAEQQAYRRSVPPAMPRARRAPPPVSARTNVPRPAAALSAADTMPAIPVTALVGANRISGSMLPTASGLLNQNKRRASASARWLRRPQSLRTAMVVHETLGPPRGLSFL